MKTCTKCGERKPLTEFHNRSASKDGKKSACKSCSNASANEWRKDNPDHLKAYQKKYREESRDAVIASNKRWRMNNPDYCRDYTKRWRDQNRDRYREYQKAYGRNWYLENRQRHRTKTREWEANNRERVNANARRWRAENREHRRSTMRKWENGYRQRRHVRSNRAIRQVLYNFLRSTGQDKSGQTSSVLGYTADELRAHLERQFSKGMSWDNHGEWHIDHIVSVAEHVRNGETDPAVVNCLTNLRPMWAKDNQSKSDRRTHLL